MIVKLHSVKKCHNHADARCRIHHCNEGYITDKHTLLKMLALGTHLPVSDSFEQQQLYLRQISKENQAEEGGENAA